MNEAIQQHTEKTDAFIKAIQTSITSGRIAEIYDFAERYFQAAPADLTPGSKLDLLCTAMKISTRDVDEIIAHHSEVSRTIKGHAFEVVFDTMMHANDIACTEVGGDSDVDRVINGCSLQLKTPYQAGCSEGIVSYKTHKTHGAKSQGESITYYHKVDGFADYLVGLVSYHPFKVVILDKTQLPRVKDNTDYILSPMFISDHDPATINAFSRLGITKALVFPENLLKLEVDECLPMSSKLLDMRSDYILRAIFIKDNFRIWDMNMRGFIREHVLIKTLHQHHIRAYPPSVTGLDRSDKCDLALKKADGSFARYQVKGLTWGNCRLGGKNTMIDCETQLSRGRVNDHPTQSRLYMDTDFEAVIMAVDPPYSNQLSLAATGAEDYNWRFYCVPQQVLAKHKQYTRRVASHQRVSYVELQQYRMDKRWFETMKKED